jgi:hypothetical protein
VVFKESNAGPFWLMEQERIEQGHNQIEAGNKVKRKLKKRRVSKKQSRT